MSLYFGIMLNKQRLQLLQMEKVVLPCRNTFKKINK